MKKYVTVQEAAQELNVGTLYVYVLLRDLKLHGRKASGRWLISASSIAARKKQLGDKNGNHTRNHITARVS